MPWGFKLGEPPAMAFPSKDFNPNYTFWIRANNGDRLFWIGSEENSQCKQGKESKKKLCGLAVEAAA
jgi:hypothetical protein